MPAQTTTETGSTEQRPEPPRPEDFDLTPPRVSTLREPVSWDKIWDSRWFWAGHAVVALIVGGATYADTHSVAVTALILFSGSFLYLFAVAILVVAGMAAFSAIWRRFQPDRKQYIKYVRALADYQIRLFHWLRLQEAWWQTLDGRRFEVELAMVLKRLGYEVRWTGRAGDGGVDLVLSRDGSEVIVQCKAHKNPIGPGPVRDLYGTMIHQNAREAWLVTTRGFSRAAQDFAKGKQIRLLKVRELLKADRPLDSWPEKTAPILSRVGTGDEPGVSRR